MKIEKKEIKKPPDEQRLKEIAKNLNSSNVSWEEVPPLMKGIIVAGSGLIVLWLSGYAFSALAHAIRGFKDLQRSLKEG
jgi:hypothetical protein